MSQSCPIVDDDGPCPIAASEPFEIIHPETWRRVEVQVCPDHAVCLSIHPGDLSVVLNGKVVKLPEG